MAEEQLLVFIILIVQGILLIGILTILVWQNKTKQRSTPHFTLAFTLAIASALLSMGEFLVDYEELNILPPLYLISGIFITLAYYFMYLHYEALISVRPPIWRHRTIFGITIASLTIYLLKLGGAYDLKGFLAENISTNLIPLDAIESILGLVVFIFATYVMIKTHKLIGETGTKIELIGIFLLLLGNLLYVFSDIIWTLGSNWEDTYSILSTIADLVLLVGIVVLLANYLLHGEYLYRIPIPIHEVMLYTNSGLLAYSRHVYSKMSEAPELHVDETIITGMFMAISSFINEIMGKKAKLKLIDVEGYQIYFTSTPEDMGTLAVITSAANYFLLKSFEKFINAIPKDLIQEINQVVIHLEDLAEKFDPILLSTFPYLTIYKKTNTEEKSVNNE